MVLSIKQKRFSMVILSVVLPMSLLATLRLTGVLNEPPTPEIVMVDTVSWSTEKPQKSVSPDEAVENSYESNNGIVSVNFAIFTSSYVVGSSSYNYQDWLGFRIRCTANTSLGFIYSMSINISRTDNNSTLNIINDPDLVENRNLDIWRFDSWVTPISEGHVMAKAANQTNFALLGIRAEWIFLNKPANHEITVTLETMVFNGTAYIKTVMPIRLGVNAP